MRTSNIKLDVESKKVYNFVWLAVELKVYDRYLRLVFVASLLEFLLSSQNYASSIIDDSLKIHFFENSENVYFHIISPLYLQGPAGLLLGDDSNMEC